MGATVEPSDDARRVPSRELSVARQRVCSGRKRVLIAHAIVYGFPSDATHRRKRRARMTSSNDDMKPAGAMAGAASAPLVVPPRFASGIFAAEPGILLEKGRVLQQ